MKDNKGFTLVEILAVITIIAIILLVIIPSVDSIIKSNKDEAYNMQINLMRDGLKNWGAANVFKLPTEENGIVEVTLKDLKKGGFISVDLRNPKTEKCFSNNIVLKIIRKNNNYKYEIDSSTITFFEGDTCEVLD